MLANCNIIFEDAFEDNAKLPVFSKKMLMNIFDKPTIIGFKEYIKNRSTSAAYKRTSKKSFVEEKTKWIMFLDKMHEYGTRFFKQKVFPYFEPLSANDWNITFSKHLDHCLRQFRV